MCHVALQSCGALVRLEVARFKAGRQHNQVQEAAEAQKNTTLSFKLYVHQSGVR